MHVKKIDDIESEVVEAGSGVSRQMLIGPEEGPNFAMRKLVIEPGGGITAHTSGAEHEQYVLGGRAKVGIGDQVYEVEKGRRGFYSSRRAALVRGLWRGAF